MEEIFFDLIGVIVWRLTINWIIQQASLQWLNDKERFGTVLLLALVLTKTVNRLITSIGDTLTYTVTVSNAGLNAITNLACSAAATYVEGSFQENGAAAAPTLQFQAAVVRGDHEQPELPWKDHAQEDAE